MMELVWPDVRSGLTFVATDGHIDVMTDDNQRRIDVIPVRVSSDPSWAYEEFAKAIDAYVYAKLG